MRTGDALVKTCRLPALPYRKTDSVADLDTVRAKPASKPKAQKPAVPGKACSMSPACDLRKRGKCAALHCRAAADYVNRGSQIDRTECHHE